MIGSIPGVPDGWIVYVCGAVVVIPAVIVLLLSLYLRAAARRATKAVEAVLLVFLAGVNRSDSELVLAQMLPERGRTLSPGHLTREFPRYVAHVAVRRVQFTRARSSDGRFSGLVKLLVRLDYQGGSNADYVFLLAKQDGVWKVDEWHEGDAFDMIDYTVE